MYGVLDNGCDLALLHRKKASSYHLLHGLQNGPWARLLSKHEAVVLVAAGACVALGFEGCFVSV